MASEVGQGQPAAARRSGEERREEVITAAFEHFALSGYNGASTEAIARDAGISQPYVFRLFGTKRELFLACHARSHELIRATFTEAARGLPPEERLQAIGRAYVDLLADRSALLFQMQSYAACSDPEIQARVREDYGGLVREVTRLARAEPHDVWRFFANGMLLNVVAALDLGAIADRDEWARQWCAPAQLIEAPRSG